MAVEFNVAATRGTIYEYYPEQIDVRPDLNGRHEKPDIEWLIVDILRHEQIQPCLIWNDGGTPVLAAGFSRWRAVSEINKRELAPKPKKLKCVYIKCNEQSAFVRNISENRMRNPTTAVDDAHNIQRLIGWEMSEEEIAQIYYPAAATPGEIKEAVKWVRGRIALIQLTPEAEKAMRTGRLDESAAQAIAKLSSAQQKALLKENKGVVSKKDVKGTVAKPQKPKKWKNDPELMRRVTAVIESADWEQYDEKNFDIYVAAEKLASLKNYVLGD